jgi:hypothetical protein
MMFRTYITTGICLRKRKKTDFKRLQYVVWRLFSKLHFLLNQEKYIKAMIYAKGKKSELRTSFSIYISYITLLILYIAK